MAALSPFGTFRNRLVGLLLSLDFSVATETDRAKLDFILTTVLLASAPLLLWHFKQKPKVVRTDYSLWSKLAFATSHLVVIATTNNGYRTSLGLLPDRLMCFTSPSCVAAACLMPLLYIEHQRTLRSTAAIAMWLILTMFYDIMQLQKVPNVLLFRTLHPKAISLVLKAAVLLLEEIPKRSSIIHPQARNAVSQEATSGFLTRTCLLWLHQTFSLGFKKVLSIEQLDDLAPEFSSKQLFNHFTPYWANVNQDGPHPLVQACLKALLLPFLSIIPARLFYVVFTLAQVIFIYDVVGVTERAGDADNLQAEQLRLISVAIVIYLGIAVSKAASARLVGRLVVFTRGILVSQIYQKSLKINYTEAQAAAAITHMSTDINGAINGVAKAQDMWTDIALVCAGSFMLALLMGYSTMLFFVPTIINTYMAWHFGQQAPTANGEWNQAIQRRTSETTAMLSQIRAVKMVGLDKVISRSIELLHRGEARYCVAVGEWMATKFTTLVFCNALTGPMLMAGGMLWTRSSAGLNTQEIYTMLAVVAIIKNPLSRTINILPDLQSTGTFFQRIENFLTLPDVHDQRQTDLFQPNEARALHIESAPDNAKKHNRTAERVIELQDASLVLQDLERPILQNVNVGIDRGQLIMVAGATGSGKSALLRLIVGDGHLSTGSAYVEPGHIAYCDQTPWICNASIQDNIVGGAQLDQEWYDSVLGACRLRNDLRRFPLYDQSPAGGEGSNLSDGQKQLVALARAIYLRYPMIVLDNVFSSLDHITARAVFESLFGRNGLLKNTGTTVIIATHSVQLLKAADQIIVINNRTASTVKTYSTDPVIRQQIATIVQGTSSARLNLAQRPQARVHLPVEEIAQQRDLAAEGEENTRRHGDIQLYKFYLQSFQGVGLCICLIYTLLAALTEIFPDEYIRVWVEVGPDSPNSFWLYFGYMLVALSSPVFTQQALRMWFSKLVPFCADNIHNTALDTLMRSTFQFISTTDHGAIVKLFSDDITETARGLPRDFLLTVNMSFALALRAVLVCATTHYSAVILPLVLGFLYKLQNYYLRTSRQIKYLEAVTKAPLYTQFAETARGLRHIRSFGWQRQSLERTLELLDASQKPFYYIQSIQQWLALVVDITTFLSVTLLVFLATHFKLPGAGVGLSMVSLIPMNMEISIVIQQWTRLEESFGSLARVRAFIKNTPVEKDPDQNDIVLPEKAKDNGRVLFSNVCAKHNADDESPALNNVSFVVPAGWKVGVVGRTGSGKSSVLLTLLNFLEFTGQITIDGVDISKIPKTILRSRYITTVSQDSIDFDESVKYNLCPWTMSISQEEEGNPNNLAIELLLTELGLWEAIGGEPGLYKKVSELGLSHGQKQLLGIARGCMQHMTFDGNIVLMDEVTSNLDPETQDKVVRVLKEVFEDATVFMVAHRTETLKGVDLMMNVEDGRVFMTAQTDSDRQLREKRDRERARAPQLRRGWEPGNYPPDLAWYMLMAAQSDLEYYEAQRRGAGSSRR